MDDKLMHYLFLLCLFPYQTLKSMSRALRGGNCLH